MRDPLAPLLADGVIDEVVGRLKAGKEAEVWLVRHGGEIVAAKVYKDRQTRSFKNNAAYTEGRRVRDTRTQRAITRGSRFGQAAAEDAWKTREADALFALHAGGVRVPKPLMFYEGVLLMELVVDATGHPAPRLIDAHVSRAEAAALYTDLRRQVISMLCCDYVHSDLSPYNVLLGRAGAVVIDFPQVVGAAHNNQAERFLQRDLENLRRFFAQHDHALRAATGDAHEIWRAYVRRELTPDFVPSRGGPGAPPPTAHGREMHHPGASQRQSRPPPPGSRAAAEGRRPHPVKREPHARAGGRHPEPSRRDQRQPQRQPEVIHVVRGTVPTAGPGHPPRSHADGGPPKEQGGAPGPAPAPNARRRRRRRGRRGRGSA